MGQFQAELGVHLFQKNLTLGLNVPAADPRVTKGGQRGTQEGYPRVSPSPALFKCAEVDLEFGSLGNSIYMSRTFFTTTDGHTYETPQHANQAEEWYQSLF